jgi:hypothetical protein
VHCDRLRERWENDDAARAVAQAVLPGYSRTCKWHVAEWDNALGKDPEVGAGGSARTGTRCMSRRVDGPVYYDLTGQPTVERRTRADWFISEWNIEKVDLKDGTLINNC